MAEKYVSIKRVVDDIKDHPLMTKLSYERIVNYAVEFMRIMGMPKIFIEKTVELTVSQYVATLPSDYFNVIQIKDKDSNICYVSAPNSFHSYKADTKYPQLTYKIQNGEIVTSKASGTILMAYTALLLDTNGIPLVPDDSIYLRALKLYIKKEWFTRLFEEQKIPLGILQNAQQEYGFAAGQCHMDMSIPSYDEMESLKNSITSLLIKDHQHASGFIDFGTEQHLKI